jgi:hypothetical protein
VLTYLSEPVQLVAIVFNKQEFETAAEAANGKKHSGLSDTRKKVDVLLAP